MIHLNKGKSHHLQQNNLIPKSAHIASASMLMLHNSESKSPRKAKHAFMLFVKARIKLFTMQSSERVERALARSHITQRKEERA